MNYIKSFNLWGVEAQQIPCIPIEGAPTEATEGAIGTLVMDVSSDNHDIYKCVASKNGVYTWEKSNKEKIGENLFVYKTAETGGISVIGEMFNTNTTEKHITSDYIPVTGGEKYCYQCWVSPASDASPWHGIVYYDEDKNVVGNYFKTDGVTETIDNVCYNKILFTPSADTAYIRVCAKTYDNAKIKVEKGETPTKFVLSNTDSSPDLRYMESESLAPLLLNGNTDYINFDTENWTMTVPEGTMACYKVDLINKIIKLPAGTVSIRPYTSTTAKVYYDYRKNMYRTFQYDGTIGLDTAILICVVRVNETYKRILPSITCPYTVNGRPYGLPARKTNEFVKGINHRGWHKAPENTLSAYRLSAMQGFNYVECDVCFTSDNVPVLLHDTTIDRTSDGTGYADAMTFEEIRQYDFGSWKSDDYAGELIPSFEEFIACCRRYSLHPYIDLKNNTTMTDERIQILIDITKKYGMLNKVTWMSYNIEILAKFNAINPKARLGLLTNEITQSIVDNVLSLKDDTNDVFIDSLHSKLTDDLVNLCIDNDIPLEVWTVDGMAYIQSLNPYISGVMSNQTIAGAALEGML